MYGYLFGQIRKKSSELLKQSADEIAKAKFTAAMASTHKCCFIGSNAYYVWLVLDMVDTCFNYIHGC